MVAFLCVGKHLRVRTDVGRVLRERGHLNHIFKRLDEVEGSCCVWTALLDTCLYTLLWTEWINNQP